MTPLPMRVIEGTAKPYQPFWRFRNAAESESGDIELEFFGPISEYTWWGDEITPKAFKDELYSKGNGRNVTLLIDSPGGDVISASVIRSTLQEYPGTVTADIVGMAASAATILITGADHIRMRESAIFMIHDPSGVAIGNIDEIKQFLDVLKTVKNTIIDTYQTKTGLPADKLSKMMSDETWMDAREAKDLGFVDEIVKSSIKKAAAMAPIPAGFANCITNYRHVPAALLQLSQPVTSSNGTSPKVNIDPAELEQKQAADRLRAEIQILI